jgi:ArsR family transcriptional regulator
VERFARLTPVTRPLLGATKPVPPQLTISEEKLTEILGNDIVNRRLTMTIKTIPDPQACESETAVCCPPDGQAAELLTVPVEGPAADDELAAFAKAIAHPTRVRILRMLAKKEARMCSHIVDELPLAQSTVSEHLRILRSAGLVQANENGPRVSYCIVPSALKRLKALLEAV